MNYQWGPKKAASNLNKHGVDFADAAGVFEDEWAFHYPTREVWVKLKSPTGLTGLTRFILKILIILSILSKIVENRHERFFVSSIEMGFNPQRGIRRK
jgi:hypothetical protein